jgi:uncharacterized membrane protein YkvA (DUF1232 family)
MIKLARKIVSTAKALRDPGTPGWAKAMVFFAAFYALMPIDIVPDFIPIIGWLDDLGVLIFAVSLLLKAAPQRAPAFARGSRASRP